VLELNAPHSVVLGISGARATLRLFPPPGSFSLRFDASSPEPNDFNSLTFRHGARPAAGLFDHGATAPQASQRLLVPFGRPGVSFVEIRANLAGTEPNRGTVTMEPAPFHLESISTRRAGRGGSGRVTIGLGGAGFSPLTGVRLEQASTSACTAPASPPAGAPAVLPAARTLFVSGEAIEAELVLADPTSAPAGCYDVVIFEQPAKISRLPLAFEIVDGASGEALEVWFAGSDSFRLGISSNLWLHYRNAGLSEIPAPLLAIAGPPNTPMWLKEDLAGAREGDLIVLGTLKSGAAGRLPPGAEERLALSFVPVTCPNCSYDPTCPAEECGVGFSARILSPKLQAIDWLTAPRSPAVSEAEWSALVPRLEETLGSTWQEYRERLSHLADRLALRKVAVRSPRLLYRFAVRDAMGLPTSAIVGQATLADPETCASTGEPAASETSEVQVIARGACDPGGEPLAVASLDAAGGFVLDWLEPGTYWLTVTGHTICGSASGCAEVAVPAGGDALAVQLAAIVGGNEGPALPILHDESRLPSAAPIPPEEVLIERSFQEIAVVTAVDPNEKLGPGVVDAPTPPGKGGGAAEAEAEPDPVCPDRYLDYTVYFHNRLSDACEGEGGGAGDAELATAWRIDVIDPIDPGVFDPYFSVVELAEVQIGNEAPLSGEREYTSSSSGSVCATIGFNGECAFGRIPVTHEDGRVCEVDVVVSLTPCYEAEAMLGCTLDSDFDELPCLVWTLKTALSGVCGSPTDTDFGFLPPSTDCDPRGQGHVTFRLKGLPGLPPDTKAENRAVVVFNWDDKHGVADQCLVTGAWSNVVSWQPSAPERVAQDVGEESVTLQWQSDCAASYDVFLWQAAAPSASELEAVRGGDRSAAHLQDWPAQVLFLDRAQLDPVDPWYWLVVARNGAEWITPGDLWSSSTVPATPLLQRGDANGDGSFDVSDVVHTLLWLFRGGAAPACVDAADTDDSGAVDITDAIASLGTLFLGGQPAAPPTDVCGEDPTEDALGCGSFPPCS
jgi:hypothetical protein